jgi:hypothetical protein
MRMHEDGHPDRFEPRSDKEKLRVDAAAARAAATKALGGYLPAFVTVKHTPIPTGSLVIAPADPNARAYVLVIGAGREFEVIGWVWGHERECGEWREDVPSPGHFIAQDALRPIDTLRDT